MSTGEKITDNNLYNLISVQRSTPSSFLVTISRPLSFSSLKVTNRSFHTSIGINHPHSLCQPRDSDHSTIYLYLSLHLLYHHLFIYYSLLTFFTPSLIPILFINLFHLRLVLFSPGLTLDTQNPRSMVIPFNFSFLVSSPVIFKYFKLHYRSQRWHKISGCLLKHCQSVAT